MFTSNKIGRFEVEAELINDNPEVVQEVMATCVVIDVQHQWHTKSVVYTAISDSFEECTGGEAPPMYDININEEGTVTWVKREA